MRPTNLKVTFQRRGGQEDCSGYADRVSDVRIHLTNGVTGDHLPERHMQERHYQRDHRQSRDEMSNQQRASQLLREAAALLHEQQASTAPGQNTETVTAGTEKGLVKEAGSSGGPKSFPTIMEEKLSELKGKKEEFTIRVVRRLFHATAIDQLDLKLHGVLEALKASSSDAEAILGISSSNTSADTVVDLFSPSYSADKEEKENEEMIIYNFSNFLKKFCITGVEMR
ncbi:hypothetical protein MAR_015286 [Mya arenaria]|uniref:Uncharacterized protein n=1 Tax=Mya arenaria TaxID=6604 RepID=A0ABY7FJU7_MYAAR|nr:hypothetical protein MAR_015286 [Mya arenaria]